MAHKPNDENQTLMARAIKAADNAYAPYTGKKTGAAVLTADGNIYTGATVENISLGAATMCAERAAVFNAVSRGEREIQKIAVYSEKEPFMPPCGLCRQVFSVFLHDGEVLLGGSEDIRVYTVKELLPLI